MPYIAEERREDLDSRILTLCKAMDVIDVPSVIYSFLVRAIGIDIDGPRYTKIMTAVGTLECVILEMESRGFSDWSRPDFIPGPLVLGQADGRLAGQVFFLAELVNRRITRGHIDGDLNYTITRIVAINAGLGAGGEFDIRPMIEDVKRHFYGAIARPYEDDKMAENGDVF